MADELWTEDERAILRANINAMPYRKLAGLLPRRTLEAVKRRATMIGAPREGKRYPWRKLDEGFFASGTLKSAYWAGFIAADGCIVTTPRREVRIGINGRDRQHLLTFCSDAGFDGAIHDGSKGIVSVAICAADRWIADLRDRFSIGPRKTFTLQPPRGLSAQEDLAYSIGYIDGDGCWSRERGKYRRLALIVVGTAAILEWMRVLWARSGASVGGATVRPAPGCSRLSISGTHAASVARLLGAVDTPKLQRKWRVARGEAFGQDKT